jgi:DNA-binding transcriptional LysR family regulator
VRRLRAAAPATRLAVIGLVPARVARQAEQGEVDLAFHTSDDAPVDLRRRPLFTERYVLVGRADHPRLRRKPSLAQLCQLEHVIVSPDGGGFRGATDQALAALGLARRVVLSVPHFLFVRSVVASSDLVAMLPERLVRGDRMLKIVESPVEVAGYEMAMLWHERSHRDPAHQWLRETIAAAV